MKGKLTRKQCKDKGINSVIIKNNYWVCVNSLVNTPEIIRRKSGILVIIVEFFYL